ncbi:MAG: DUF4393 domain-containing protein [Actinomycetota bacterium]|nr:DUF4393 domain-containing protein [Actinomycetota bacterium]MDQ5807581.1 DUF4393 domain-containing protein [Actinomycetota bacterium]
MQERDEHSTDLVPHVMQEAGEEVGRFMGTVFGSASLELDQMIGERVGWWRFKQSCRLAQKAKKLIEDEHLSPHQVPLRTAVPLLEAASLEDDEELVDRWAALLANASAETVEVPPSFANVLRELEPATARLLDQLYDDVMTIAPEIRPHFSIFFEQHDKEEAGNFPFHVDNLMRLGLVRSGTFGQAEEYQHLVLTEFGRSFVRACRPPGTPDPPIKWPTAPRSSSTSENAMRARAARKSRCPPSQLES